MNLKLIRLLAAVFEGRLKPQENWGMDRNNIRVQPLVAPAYDKDKGTLVVLVAETVLSHALQLDDSRSIVIPQDLRRALERTAEGFADVLAVVNRCKRSLLSPHPYIAVEPLDADAASYLSTANAIHVPRKGTAVRMYHDYTLETAIPHLSDRLDGVSILAESLCQGHPTGRLHELIRFFERAFAASASRVCRGLLPSFLAAADQGFTSDEVARWLQLRDTSVHADRRPDFALEGDTRPVVNRMEQAAYDVLFNKLQWHDATLDRRLAFRPVSGSMSGTDGGIFVTQGKGTRLDWQILDGFGAYVYWLQLVLKDLPSTWFTTISAQKTPGTPH